MIPRTRFLITTGLVCHLLLAHALVTSQLLFAQNNGPDVPASPSAQEEVVIRALEQEKDGPVYKLRGQAHIEYETYTVSADTMEYNSDTGEVSADGHVVIEGGGNHEHIEADHAAYNIRLAASNMCGARPGCACGKNG